MEKNDLSKDNIILALSYIEIKLKTKKELENFKLIKEYIRMLERSNLC